MSAKPDKPALSKRLSDTAKSLRKSRIKAGGPLKSAGIPREIALENSRKVSPRVVRNAAIKEQREFSRIERARIRENTRPTVE